MEVNRFLYPNWSHIVKCWISKPDSSLLLTSFASCWSKKSEKDIRALFTNSGRQPIQHYLNPFKNAPLKTHHFSRVTCLAWSSTPIYTNQLYNLLHNRRVGGSPTDKSYSMLCPASQLAHEWRNQTWTCSIQQGHSSASQRVRALWSYHWRTCCITCFVGGFLRRTCCATSSLAILRDKLFN